MKIRNIKKTLLAAHTFFIALIIFSVFFSVSAKKAFAIIGTEIPGLHCGVAGGKSIGLLDSSEDCCTTTKRKCFDLDNSIFSVVKIPILYTVLETYSRNCKLLEEINNQNGVKECIVGQPDRSGIKCVCKMDELPAKTNDLIKICQKAMYKLSPAEMDKCVRCTQGVDLNGKSIQIGMYTALGCIPLEINTFIQKLFSLGIGLAGFISFLCIIYSAVRLQISGGKPETIKKASETLRSCIFGLLLIIFAVFILRLVGVNILQIPGMK